jgi:hypothetical protein
LRGQGGAKFTEFRPTRKKKKFQWGENHEPVPKPLSSIEALGTMQST